MALTGGMLLLSLRVLISTTNSTLWPHLSFSSVSGFLYVCVCLKAEEFESKAHGLLEWLTDAERHLRYQGSVQDLAEVLEQQLGDHQVQSAIVSLYVNN